MTTLLTLSMIINIVLSASAFAACCSCMDMDRPMRMYMSIASRLSHCILLYCCIVVLLYFTSAGTWSPDDVVSLGTRTECYDSVR